MSLPAIKVNAWGWRLAIFGIVLATIFYARLWQPHRQIVLHQKYFLLALEDRRWGKLNGFLAPDYSDRFGHTRETVVQDLRDVLRQFFSVSLHSQGTTIDEKEGVAMISANITLSGNGPGYTDFITNEVNKLTAPWVFTWKKQSFLPWDWRLERVDNPSLNVSSRSGNF